MTLGFSLFATYILFLFSTFPTIMIQARRWRTNFGPLTKSKANFHFYLFLLNRPFFCCSVPGSGYYPKLDLRPEPTCCHLSSLGHNINFYYHKSHNSPTWRHLIGQLLIHNYQRNKISGLKRAQQIQFFPFDFFN